MSGKYQAAGALGSDALTSVRLVRQFCEIAGNKERSAVMR
jgi:hypothetical protein